MISSAVKQRRRVGITGKHLTQLCAIIADIKYLSKCSGRQYKNAGFI